MTKLPLLPKHTGPEHVDVIPQTMPYRHPKAGASTAGNPSAARHRPNGAIDTAHTAPDISAQPTHTCPNPPGSLNDCFEDEAYHLEGDAKQNYRRNMLLLAADVKERITSRGRHAHGRLHDSKLADSVRNLEKLVGCFEHLSPHPPCGRFERPTQYLADIKSFWITQDSPAAVVQYLPCWELVAGRRLTVRERAAMGIDVFLDGEIKVRKTAGEWGCGGREGEDLGRRGRRARFEGLERWW
ncbi:hypothetical protein MMC15_006539 [Xylographa vitiligo]|nr:hypothetical protein [Xylographa vitiligo]